MKGMSYSQGNTKQRDYGGGVWDWWWECRLYHQHPETVAPWSLTLPTHPDLIDVGSSLGSVSYKRCPISLIASTQNHWGTSFQNGGELRPDGKEFACNAGDPGSISGEGNGNPLQYSCLKIPWTEEPVRLHSMGSQRVGHDWVTNTLRWMRCLSSNSTGLQLYGIYLV